jgi:hypothetical protein
MTFQEIQLTIETEGRGIEIETLVHTRRPAQQDSAHESLSPCKIISPHKGIGPDVVFELPARRRDQTDDPGFLRLCPKLAPTVRLPPIIMCRGPIAL